MKWPVAGAQQHRGSQVAAYAGLRDLVCPCGDVGPVVACQTPNERRERV